jgi:hypothetical protein
VFIMCVFICTFGSTNIQLNAHIVIKQTASNEDSHTYLPMLTYLSNWKNPFAVEVEVGANVKPDSLTLQRAKELGVGSIRLHRRLSWRKAQPEINGPIDLTVFADFEEELRGLSGANIVPMVTVWDYPRWATAVANSCSPIKPEHINAYAGFVSRLVNRYKNPPFNVKYWEMGNEPDVDVRAVPPDSIYGCWGNYDDQEFYGGRQYGEMLKVAGAAIRSADPEATVIMGGVIMHTPYGNPPGSLTEKFLRGVFSVGAAPFFDILPFHGHALYYNRVADYSGSSAGGWGNPDPNKDGPTRGKTAIAKAVMASFGVTKTLWLNEVSMGCKSDESWCMPPSESYYQAMADHLPRMMSRALNTGVERISWYTLAGGGWNYTDLLKPDNSPTPAFISYQNLIAQLNGTSLPSIKVNYANGVEAYRFSRAGRVVDVVFVVEGDSKIIELPADKLIQAVSRDGVTIIPDQANGIAKVTIGFSPVYIHRRL